MLGPIRCVTVTVPDLARAIRAYEAFLDYSVVLEFRLSETQADYLGASALADAPCALLQPASGADFFFRFIEQDLPADYRAFTTFGWNASELIVRDVDALERRLQDSPFRIVGPPENLSFSEAIRAMQVIGPAEEVLYLTMVREPLAEFDLPEPACDVDRAFIVILGGPDMPAIQRFYRRRHQVPEAPVIEAKISVLSQALGLPQSTLHPIAALPLAGQSLIEVDAYPTGTSKRRRRRGCLPPAMAVVSFATDRLPPGVPQGQFAAPPYEGRPGALITGAAGELIELIRR